MDIQIRKKKIAICFSGIMSRNKFTPISIKKNLIDSLAINAEVDVFIYMSYINCVDNDLNSKFKLLDSKTNSRKRRELIKFLEPKDYKFYEFNSTIEKKVIQNFIPYLEKYNQKNKNYAINGINMYYNIYKCNELKKKYEKKHNFKYDYVIRARLDYIFCFSLLFDDLQLDSLAILKDRYNSWAKPNLYTNDKFFMGPSEMMDNLCLIYNNIEKYFKNKNCLIEGQNLFMYHCKELNYSPIKIGIPFIYFKYKTTFKLSKCNIKTIKIPLIDNKFMYELTYCLLFNGYKVITEKNSFYTAKLAYLEMLSISEDGNYECEINKQNDTIIIKYLTYIVSISCKNIIPYGQKVNSNKYIFNIQIIEFIINYILKGEKFQKEKYYFDSSMLYKINSDDKIIYFEPGRNGTVIVANEREISHREKKLGINFLEKYRYQAKLLDYSSCVNTNTLYSNYNLNMLYRFNIN